MDQAGQSVVAGSLGDQGGAVARALHAAGIPVRALAHHPESPAAARLRAEGIEVVADDLEQPDAVRRHLEGAVRLFAALTPFDEGGLAAELRQLGNLAAAAAAAHVAQVVCSVVGDPDQDRDLTAGGIWGIERLLREHDLPLVLLRPAFFMENIDEFALRREADGSLCLSLPLDIETRLQWIAVEDVGQIVRLVFERPGLLGAGPVELAGDELTVAEALALLAEWFHEPVAYWRVSLDEVENTHARGMYRWFQVYPGYRADIDLARRLRPRLLTFGKWLAGGHLDVAKVERRPNPIHRETA